MNIKAIYLYLLSVLWLIILVFLFKFFHLSVTGLGMTLLFLTMIFIPGLLLWRLSKVEAKDLTVKLLYIIAFGFIYYFLINLLGIIFSLMLSQVLGIIYYLGIILFIISCWQDRREIWTINFKGFREYAFSDWFLVALALMGSLVGFLAINVQVDKIIGDGMFHLAILQKIITSENLNPYNLWVTKASALNPVYSFPIWHILVGEVAKFSNINIFTAYTQILLPLTIIFFIVVFTFLKIVFQKRYLTLTLYIVFLILMLSGIFYTLIPLRSPDSLNRLLFLPMVLGLTIEYLFDKNVKILPRVFIVALLVILMGLIHFTQLINYFLILFVFLILFLIILRDQIVLKKFGWLVLTLVGLTLPYLLIFQRENIWLFLSGNTIAYRSDELVNGSYHNANILILYTIFSLPFLALFAKLKPRLIFLISVPITLIMISWQMFGLRPIFLKYLGEIFTIRAVTDNPSFVFFGVILFTIILVLSLILGRLPKIIQNLLYIFLAMLVLIVLLFFKNYLNFFVDETIFNAKNLFFYEYFRLVFAIISSLLIVIYFIFHFYYKKEFIVPELNNKFSFVFLAFLFFLILSWPYWPVLGKTMANNSNGSLIANREIAYYGDTPRIGGQKTLEFLNTIPPKSIIAFSNVAVSQTALLYTEAYAFEYPYGIVDFTLTKTIYDPLITPEKRLQLLEANSIDYIVVLRSSESDLFKDQQHFRKVFENNYTYNVQTKKDFYQKEGEFVVYKFLRKK